MRCINVMTNELMTTHNATIVSSSFKYCLNLKTLVGTLLGKWRQCYCGFFCCILFGLKIKATTCMATSIWFCLRYMHPIFHLRLHTSDDCIYCHPNQRREAHVWHVRRNGYGQIIFAWNWSSHGIERFHISVTCLIRSHINETKL